MKDYYKILEIPSNATTVDIKKSFRRLAKKYHPDTNFGDEQNESKFKEIVEAYEVLNDEVKRKSYDFSSNFVKQSSTNYTYHEPKQEQKRTLSPTEILSSIVELQKEFFFLDRPENNLNSFMSTIDKLLSNDNIEQIVQCNQVEINRRIVSELCCYVDYLKDDQKERIKYKLIAIAGEDKESIAEINIVYKKTSIKKNNSVKNIGIVIGIIVIFITLYYFTGKDSPKAKEKVDVIKENPKNGDLNKTFFDNENKTELTQKEIQKFEKEILKTQGWDEVDVSNGQMPECYNFAPKKGSLDNYLDVSVGSGTDVAIKVMNVKNNNCVRYVFINSKSSYRIKNIPEGKYYLKIAYGKEWMSRVENNQCVGKFAINSMYEKGIDVFDFRRQNTENGYYIPSYKLQLDVKASEISNSFNSKNISESDFND